MVPGRIFPFALALALVGAVGSAARAQLVELKYDNGQANGLGLVGLVTHPGAGAGGFDVSQRPATTAPTDFTGGFAIQNGVFGIADSFTVPSGQTLGFNTVRVYAYVSEPAGNPIPPLSPITEMGVSILTAAPSTSVFPYAPGANVVTKALRLNGQSGFNSTWSEIWRTPAGNTSSTARAIFAVTLTLPSTYILNSGQYWLAYAGKGTSLVNNANHNIFTVPLTAPGASGSTYPAGNAMQLNGSWGTIADGTPSQGVKFPFQFLQVTSPEPGSALLLVPGGALLLALRRRRR